MSTLPHDPSHATAADNQTPVMPSVARYEQQVDDAVTEFEAGTYWLRVPRPPTAELRDVCRKVAAFTAELYPDGMVIKVRNDPEITDDIYFVFHVVDSGSEDDIVARDNEWHRRLRQVVDRQAELFCLSIATR